MVLVVGGIGGMVFSRGFPARLGARLCAASIERWLMIRYTAYDSVHRIVGFSFFSRWSPPSNPRRVVARGELEAFFVFGLRCRLPAAAEARDGLLRPERSSASFFVARPAARQKSRTIRSF